MLGACTQLTHIRKFERNRVFVTVAILAQGTHWATAAKQASCPGSIPAAVVDAKTLGSCKPAWLTADWPGLLACWCLNGRAWLLAQRPHQSIYSSMQSTAQRRKDSNAKPITKTNNQHGPGAGRETDRTSSAAQIKQRKATHYSASKNVNRVHNRCCWKQLQLED